ncbi:CHAT domain-containing protein [Xylaria arbuscula]|nr:CHAT domain-containing protein [Xylaria arbuscula]
MDSTHADIINDEPGILEYAYRLEEMGSELMILYSNTKEIAFLDKALRSYQKALQNAPRNDSKLQQRLFQNIEDLDNAIQYLQQALGTSPLDDPEFLSGQHDELGDTFKTRYEKLGTIADLEDSVKHFQSAINATPEGHEELSPRLMNLGSMFGNRYLRLGDLADIEKSLSFNQRSLKATAADSPIRAALLQNIGRGYHDRYLNTAVMSDLSDAIIFYKEALNTTPEEDSKQPNRLQALGSGFGDRYQRTGNIDDIEEAIRLFADALRKTPKNHPELSFRLQNLSAALATRYGRKGVMGDLDHATTLSRLAVEKETNPVGDMFWSRRLETLAIVYQKRYVSTGAIQNLDHSIHYYQEVLNNTPADDPNRPFYLHCVGNSYADRYHRTWELVDLEQSIRYSRDALNLTPIGHAERPKRLHNLAGQYNFKYQQCGSIPDQEQSFRLAHEALELLPSDHLDRRELLTFLGHIYREQSIQYCHEALKLIPLDHPQLGGLFDSLAASYYANARTRIGAASFLLEAYSDASNWAEAHQAAVKALSLVQLLVPRYQERGDKQYHLSRVSGLASDAAAVSLNAGQSPYEAIRLLEQGWGIITGSVQDIRADISDLLEQHSKYSTKLLAFREILDHPQLTMISEHALDSRYKAARDFEKIVEEVRQLSGFERFLLGPSEDEIKAAVPSGGYIVVINVSQYRCDALIIERGQIQIVRLPDLRLSDIQDHAPQKKGMEKLESLQWLWRTVARPIFDAIGLEAVPPDGVWPRIWWVPTGALSKFPIHAAGDYSMEPRSGGSVLDRAISSYSTSIKALVHGRGEFAQRRSRDPSNKSVTLVAMRHTPQLSSLKFAAEEVDQVEALCNCLLLEDWQNNPLTVARLFETNLHSKRPFLAFLSACGTGRVRQDSHADEGLHLIGGCQLAGFRHVIGTLWNVKDKVCVEMALETYDWIRQRGITDASVSEALHNASRKLRAGWVKETAERIARIKTRSSAIEATSASDSLGKDPRDVVSCDDEVPLYWVPYIHLGN